MRSLAHPAGVALIALIRLYQLSVGRMLPQRCRFHPSCSEYAVQSIRTNGLIKGGAAAAWRVVRCGPWSPGGVDHVRLRGVTEEVPGG